MTAESNGHLPLAGSWLLWRLAALRTAGLPFACLDALALDPDGALDTDDPNPLERARAVAARGGRLLVSDDRLLEAVTWQNPRLVDNWLGDYAARVRAAGVEEPTSLSRRGQREVLLATLAQRYCAKNETIGFFGPVAWARFASGADGITVTGNGGLRRRELYVEDWLMADLAAVFAADGRLADDVPLRRNPLVSVRAGLVYQPRAKPRPVAELADELLSLLDHPLTARALRGRVDAAKHDSFDAAVADLLRSGAVRREVAIPIGAHPEDVLRAAVAALPPGAGRDEWTAKLADLDTMLDGIRRAVGDPVAVRSALSRLDDWFTPLIGGVERDKSTTPYGRTPVYEDCRRDLDIVIGPDLCAELAAPLRLLLDSGNWLVSEVAEEVRRDLAQRYAALRRREERVTLGDLQLACADVLSGAPGTAVHRVADDFTARWGELLDGVDGDGRLDVAGVRSLADALFPPPADLGWQAARQHSPDLMLRHVAGRERPQWVLGELHLALNTLENRPFVTQADDPDELRAYARRDFSGGRLVPMFPRSSAEVTSRTYPPLAIDLPELYDYWSYAVDEGHPDGVPTWPSSILEVVEDGGELVVTVPGRAWTRPVLEFFGEFLTALVVDRFHLRPPGAYRSRLLFDDVVVERAAWTVPAADVPADDDPAQRAASGWLVDLGCPRYVFVKAKGERKPFLVDRCAPLLLRNLVRVAKRERATDPGAQLRITEMLPAPDELVVHDADGFAYTSELRVVAVWDGGPPVDIAIGTTA